MKRISVFCGARHGQGQEFNDIARSYGTWIAKNNFQLVYGGGHTGLMGVLADEVLKNGSQVIGVIPQSLVDRELAHTGLTELHLVSSMHERKQKMADLGDAFLALPGGFGTLDELCEIITWKQLGFHQKPIALANDGGFFDEFISFYHSAKEKGFIAAEDVGRITVLTSSKDLAWKSQPLPK